MVVSLYAGPLYPSATIGSVGLGQSTFAKLDTLTNNTGSLALLTRTLGIVSGASVLTALHASGAAGLSGIEGFLAGYHYAFLAAGGGLLAALALSLVVPRAWSRR